MASRRSMAAAALAVAFALLAAPALAQTNDCARSIPNCNTCRYQLYKGTVTKAICTSCVTGYVVKASGRACWCAAGYYQDANGVCQPCGNNYWCPGAKSTAASADRRPCGANKITTTNYAQSDRECLAAPGFGWAPGDGSTACDIGYYNPGYNNRKCTMCPASLTTNSTGTVNLQDCRAGAGYYYLAGKAVACAEGFYKPTIGNFDCYECPTGFSTATGVVGQTDKSACNVVRPGYSAPATIVPGVTEGTPCPPNTYRSGFVTHDGKTSVDCVPCNTGLQTFPNVTAATSLDQCLAPPGYGFDKTNIAAAACAVGSFNLGWNREACTSCGGGAMATDAPGATSQDACYTPAGYGNVRAADGTLTASICPLNTYGVPNNTYGLVDVACTKCLDNSGTNSTGSTRAADCLTNPGFGYYSGSILKCEYGQYNPGFNQAPCTACGEGYNTTADPAHLPNALATRGASQTEACAVDFGWAYVDSANKAKGIKPCTQGWYKALLGDAACTQCPAGTTSTIALAAVALTDCNACRPGFGAASINLNAPSCDICTSGTFSAGMVAGGGVCQACPKLEHFTGTMVSRPGAATTEECVGEFPTDAGSMENGLNYDYIKFPDASLTAVGQSGDTEATCQEACRTEPKCQYFEFRSYKNSGDRCRIKVGPAPVATSTLVDGAAPVIVFEVKSRAYVVYPATNADEAAATGETIAAGLTFAAAKDQCDKADACIGFAKVADGTYRTFSGTLFDFTVGKLRAAGEAINTWVALPSGAPYPTQAASASPSPAPRG